MPFAYPKCKKQGIFHRSKMTDDALKTCKTSEIKAALKSRNISTTRIFEKSELVRAYRDSDPKEVMGWSAVHNSKWKASYVCKFNPARKILSTKALTRPLVDIANRFLL